MRTFTFAVIVTASGVLINTINIAKGTTMNVVNHNVTLKSDTVAYSYNSVMATDHRCKECYLKIKYPVIKDKIALRNAIDHKLFDYTKSKYVTADFATFFKKFAKTYRSSYKVGDKDFTETFDCKIIVQKQENGLIVMNLGEEWEGGAHPNYNLSFLNWDTRTDRAIKLDDVFVTGYKTQLTAISKKIFERNATVRGFKMTDYTFDKGVFALNNNFKLTSKGIYFYYNNYEIQSYADGPTELLIPYASIKQLLRPNTVITQYIK